MQLRKVANVGIEGRLESFAAVARAYAATHAGKPTEDKVFFIRIVYEEAQETFRRLGVTRLPYVARLPANIHVRASGPIALSNEDVLNTSPASGLTAKEFGAFLQERTGLNPGDLSAVGAASRSRFLPILTLAFLGGVCYVGWQLYKAPFMRWPQLYAAGAVGVYWFATSGGMYNIIRGVPMVGYDRKSSAAIVFTRGSGQMGAEGFMMGSIYLLFGLVAAAFIWLMPHVKDEATRRQRGWLLLGASAVLLQLALYNHSWKTYMNPRWYLW